ncbi:MAG: YggT family protein [Eubacterium sp.]
MIESILLTAGYYLFEFISFMLVASALLSWLPLKPDNPILRFVYTLTEPILSPLRRFTVIGAIDFSAIAALLIIQIAAFPLYKWIIMAIF